MSQNKDVAADDTKDMEMSQHKNIAGDMKDITGEVSNKLDFARNYASLDTMKTKSNSSERVSIFCLTIWKKILSSNNGLDGIALAVKDKGIISKGAGAYLTTFFKLSGIIVFWYLFVSDVNQLAYTQKFVSLDPTAGNCQNVPVVWSAPMLHGDKAGFWMGQAGYNEVDNIYDFSVYNFAASQDVYASWINSVQSSLVEIGKKAQTRDLVVNLMYW